MKRYEQGSLGMRPDPEGLWCGYTEADAKIKRQQAQIALLKAVVRELAPYPADKLPPHIKKALGE